MVQIYPSRWVECMRGLEQTDRLSKSGKKTAFAQEQERWECFQGRGSCHGDN